MSRHNPHTLTVRKSRRDLRVLNQSELEARVRHSQTSVLMASPVRSSHSSGHTDVFQEDSRNMQEKPILG